MLGELVDDQLADVGRALRERTDDLAPRIARTISREVEIYRTRPVPVDLVTTSCAANMRSVFVAFSGHAPVDPAPAIELGAARARDGVPLASVLDAYRVGVREVWAAAAQESSNCERHSDELLRVMTARIFAAQDILSTAMADAYHRERARLFDGHRDERSALIDEVLQRRPFDDWSVWEAAELLGLPSDGPFVVIAAEVVEFGSESLPGIEPKLRSMDGFSVWRSLPDLQVGIVHVRDDSHLDGVLGLVTRMATARVGVSERFDDLRQAAEALRHARVSMRGRRDPGTYVSVFDGSILATAAVSAPEVMVKLATPIVECFDGLARSERDVLFDTFRAWRDNGGSLRSVGEILFCHPNTVRYRLHRIEQRTGRSLAKPRDVAELGLALEVQHRLMWHREHPGPVEPDP
ncbi:helix-turn-helix domain-containing protein [Mycobacterium sp. DL99]|uniref:PucR family transcriptional regulator n=1 Tax=Mycobacterium sp. DL99 TaxID=2528957 RepID=UPI0014368411|nr:helix-turn-helix domain-containing protein [Mycobacterium sp. DL99]